MARSSARLPNRSGAGLEPPPPPTFPRPFPMAGGWGSPAVWRALAAPGNSTFRSNLVSRVSLIPPRPALGLAPLWALRWLGEGEDSSLSHSLPPSPPPRVLGGRYWEVKARGLANCLCRVKEQAVLLETADSRLGAEERSLFYGTFTASFLGVGVFANGSSRLEGNLLSLVHD